MMPNALLLPTVLTLSTLASAQNDGLPVSGPFLPGIGGTPEARQVSEAAGRRPNATEVVTFTRNYNTTAETWAWRVNLTEMAVPNRLSDLGRPSANFSEGLRVANTQWQLDWPGDDDSLQSFLGDRNLNISFTTIVSHKPSNITDHYNDMDNGNCAAILGDECTQSLTQGASRGNFRIPGLKGCENTLDVNEGGPDDGVGFDITATEPDSGLRRGDTLFFRTSETYTAGNLTQLHQSERALQIFAMTFRYGAGPRGDTGGPTTVLCRIINKGAAESAAASSVSGWHHSITALWGMTLLSILATMWLV